MCTPPVVPAGQASSPASTSTAAPALTNTPILFRNATVITGEDPAPPPFVADVLVVDSVIASITPPGALTPPTTPPQQHSPSASGETSSALPPNTRVIDIAGNVLCPGFIDMHAHSDLYLLTHGAHEAKISQGVTTEVVGQDGISYYPVANDQQMGAIRAQIAGWNGNPSDEECATSLKHLGMFEWKTLGGYLDALDRARTATNVAVLVPQGNLRLLACGPYDSPAKPEELVEQTKLLREGMAQGAVGMSSGLTYTPGMYASTSELATLCKVLGEYPGAYYAPHHRSYGANALGSYEEMLGLSEETGCPVHLTHATMNFEENRGRANELIAMIDKSRATGADVTLDTYPYLPGCTTLSALLPSWATAGGPEETLTRLESAEIRDKIRVAVEVTGCDGGHGIPTNWEEIEIGSTTHPDLEGYGGRRVAEVAASLNRPAMDVFFEVLQKDKLATACLMHIGDEANVQLIMQHPTHMGGSDAILHGSTLHPRAWGTFPRYLGHYARDVGLIPLPEMVAHLTSRPAKRLGVFPQRGVVRVGSKADLVVFDPEEVRDMSSHAEPKRPAEGIRFVLVNGEVAMDGGKCTGARAGWSLRRRKDGQVTSKGE